MLQEHVNYPEWVFKNVFLEVIKKKDNNIKNTGQKQILILEKRYEFRATFWDY